MRNEYPTRHHHDHDDRGHGGFRGARGTRDGFGFIPGATGAPGFGGFGPRGFMPPGPQRKRRGDVRIAILSLLSEKPSNGYGLIKSPIALAVRGIRARVPSTRRSSNSWTKS
jgi:hypothetical protein